jgi:hypothetical protein
VCHGHQGTQCSCLNFGFMQGHGPGFLGFVDIVADSG